MARARPAPIPNSTRRPLPSLGRPEHRPAWMPGHANLDWMDSVACTTEDTWVAEKPPSRGVCDHLAFICFTCPVRAQCAAYALDTGAHSGMYAGVWLPWRGAEPSAHYLDARAQLAARFPPKAS